MSHAKIFQARPQASPEACRAHGLQNHRWQHPACENTRLSLCCLCWLLHSWKSSQTIVDFFFSLRKHLTVLILHCNFNKICHRSAFWEEKKTSLALSWALCPVSFMLLKTDTLTTNKSLTSCVLSVQWQQTVIWESELTRANKLTCCVHPKSLYGFLRFIERSFMLFSWQ